MQKAGVRHTKFLVASAKLPRDGTLLFGKTGTALQCDILRTLLYFDIFDYPLRSACLSLPLKNQIMQKDEYYFLKCRPETIVENRREKERRARLLWRIARLMARIVGGFPFVKAIFVSGELSKGVASEHSDIDFLIVAGIHRVWIVRTLCAAFKRVFLFNQKKFFCYNHIVSEHRLEVTERNIYTATEIVTLKPLLNTNLFEKFLQVNSWTKDHLANSSYQNPTVPNRPSGRPIIERIIDFLVPHTALDTIDHWLLKKWRRVWVYRYPSMTPAKRTELFRCTTDISTSYVKDFSARIMGEYEQRLIHYGLASDIATQGQYPEIFKYQPASH